MSYQAFLAYGAFVISGITVAVNVWQFLRKRRTENNELANLALRATAERDSFVVKGAEGALLMMEKMLTTATSEAASLRERIATLEAEKRSQAARIDELERQNREQAARLTELERREREHNGPNS